MTEYPPVQYKGEIMDFEFTLEVDHRKRRRNRATQSCLNCHTSKRKCDRKRPCQRCIQLGLTGLCVYEIDDPALRDDPSVDETTRLRNRIAELESLVRELRGKPHPRWADANFREGDPSEKWHSRSSKRSQTVKKSRNLLDADDGSTSVSSPSIKTEPDEPNSGSSQPRLYRLSPSPGPQSPVCLHSLQPELGSPLSAYEGDHIHASYTERYREDPSYQMQSGSLTYGDRNNGGVSDVNGHFQITQSGHVRTSVGDPYPVVEPFCSCLTDPAAAHSYIGFSQHLQKTLDYIQQFPHHRAGSECLLYRRMVELNDIMHGNPPDDVHPSTYNGIGSCIEHDAMSPASSSSTGSSSTLQTPVHEWNNLPTGHYNSSFILVSPEDRMYDKNISYSGVV
ncbi:hypothetical protein NEOLEDRAFT_1069443 [Neolentinus lepideus HHB14362 ss-1]|uniref:Zn(2)-C6 fungal-type domain-containing protein n=1 Tax=Neolentinus lepideus HHB14362 ss-1 TaxID=1314782 RepID=A0A165R749_9AGAM|nr:hypothetical protein NEOLEDRAFT_1069443 [Neolentinus lepideus HHB14362 ss-1]